MPVPYILERFVCLPRMLALLVGHLFFPDSEDLRGHQNVEVRPAFSDAQIQESSSGSFCPVAAEKRKIPLHDEIATRGEHLVAASRTPAVLRPSPGVFRGARNDGGKEGKSITVTAPAVPPATMPGKGRKSAYISAGISWARQIRESAGKSSLSQRPSLLSASPGTLSFKLKSVVMP